MVLVLQLAVMGSDARASCPCYSVGCHMTLGAYRSSLTQTNAFPVTASKLSSMQLYTPTAAVRLLLCCCVSALCSWSLPPCYSAKTHRLFPEHAHRLCCALQSWATHVTQFKLSLAYDVKHTAVLVVLLQGQQQRQQRQQGES